jgi:hypothetical protein
LDVKKEWREFINFSSPMQNSLCLDHFVKG